ncbi:MAG: STAS/SEC14 domain-containing protein [Pirellulales bacterium]
MSETIDIVASGKMLEVRITGKLTKEAYEKLVPVVDKQIKEYGKVRFLVILEDFHGWTMGAIWEDTKFDLAHWHDIEKLAIVGETKWEAGMAVFCKPFTTAKIKYFDHAKLDEARKWIAE